MLAFAAARPGLLYNAPAYAPLAYSSPLTYSGIPSTYAAAGIPYAAAPLAYNAYNRAPITYTAGYSNGAYIH